MHVVLAFVALKWMAELKEKYDAIVSQCSLTGINTQLNKPRSTTMESSERDLYSYSTGSSWFLPSKLINPGAAMASHLHARRRQSAGETDPETGEHLLAAGSPEKYHHHGRRKPRIGALGYAVLAIVSFLGGGLGLGYLLLHHRHKKVILHILNDPWTHGRGILHGRHGFRHHFYSGPPRVVTIVLPSVVKPHGRTDRLKAIQDTWGQYARAIYVVHNVSEFPDAAHAVWSATSQPIDIYSFPQLLVIPDDIGVEKGLKRLYHTMQTIYTKINPDFAFFVNDHTFVLNEHLCLFLEARDPAVDLYAGHALKEGDKSVFNSGAAGYVLSRATLKKLVEKWDQHDPGCWEDPDMAKEWLQGNPGLVTVQCLNSLNINAFDTRAAGQEHRFHAFPLTRTVAGKVDEWYNRKHVNMGQFKDFDSSYETLPSGEDCCSKDSISFHYVEAAEARALFSTRSALLNNPHMTDHELKSYMLIVWPTTFSDLGGYSRGLPNNDRVQDWKELLAVMRKISSRDTQHEC